MCVAIFKPAGTPPPSLETLAECWSANPDGAGIAVSESRAVYVRKGFMKLAELKAFYNEKNLADRVSQAMIFHFRIGTHGLKDAGNTHPFPISNKPEILRRLEGKFPTAVAHNGIFTLKVSLPDVSDTGQYMADCFDAGVTPEAYWKAHPSVKGWSRLVVLRPDNRYRLLGDWHCDTDEDGCFYSNLSWQRSSYMKKYGNGGAAAGRTGYDSGFDCGTDYQGFCGEWEDGDWIAGKWVKRQPKDNKFLTPSQLAEEESYFGKAAKPAKEKKDDKVDGDTIIVVVTEPEKPAETPAASGQSDVLRNWLGGDMNKALSGKQATLEAAGNVLKRINVKTRALVPIHCLQKS